MLRFDVFRKLPAGRQKGCIFPRSMQQPNPFSVKMDDLRIDALDLGRIGCPKKQRADLVDVFVLRRIGTSPTASLTTDANGVSLFQFPFPERIK